MAFGLPTVYKHRKEIPRRALQDTLGFCGGNGDVL